MKITFKSALLLISVLTIVRGQGSADLNGNGIHFDSSCDPYRKSLDEATKSVYKMATKAIKGAKPPTHPYFKLYFEEDQRRMVQLVLRNIARTIAGHDHRVLIKCNEDGLCLEDLNKGAYLDRYEDAKDDFINMCRHILDDGPGNRKVTHDFCSKGKRNETVASLLMHELIHVYSIANNTWTIDYAYSQADCQKLGTGRVVDQDGEKLLATENANNYVWFAENYLWWLSLTSPNTCPDIDRSELRKLLSTDGSDASLPDLHFNKPSIIPNGLTLIVEGSGNDSDIRASP